MTRENVELVRGGYEHFNRTGEPPWEFFHPEAEFDASAVVGFSVIRGREQVVASLRDYGAAFDDWRMEPEEILDAGEQIIAVVRDSGRLKGTGDEISNRFVHLFEFDSGKVIRWKTFLNRAQALEAAGLSE